MRPAHGVTLTIDDDVISDEAHIVFNGTEAVAWVHNPDEDPETGEPIGMEVVGKLRQASEQRNPSRIVGTSVLAESAGQNQEWRIAPGRGCKDC